MNNPHAAFHACLGRETFAALAHDFESTVDLRGCVRLSYVLLVCVVAEFRESLDCGESLMGKWRTGIALPTELLPHLVEQIGVEPMTDNPMSSAHQKKAGKKATVELPGVLKVAPLSQATDRICTGIAGSTRTHNLRPAKNFSQRVTQRCILTTLRPTAWKLHASAAMVSVVLDFPSFCGRRSPAALSAAGMQSPPSRSFLIGPGP